MKSYIKKEEIHTSLDNMLANLKTRNFINHLVRSYIPNTNIEKVFDAPKDNFKCVITKKPLSSINDILDGIKTEELKEDFLKHLNSMFSEAPLDSQILNLLGDKEIGITGKNTTTFMSVSGYKEFSSWVSKKSINGDKHINWLLATIRKTTTPKKTDNVKQQKTKTVDKTNNLSAFSLGEASDVLSKLKTKMEDNK